MHWSRACGRFPMEQQHSRPGDVGRYPELAAKIIPAPANRLAPQMRKPKDEPLAKIEERIPVSPHLQQIMREIFEQIDGWTDMPFEDQQDDSIQVTGISGRRTRDKRRPFRLTYTPPGVPTRIKWELALDQTEIEDIGDGQIQELKLYRCMDPDCGQKSSLPDFVCGRCDWNDV